MTPLFPIAKIHPLLLDTTINCTFDALLQKTDAEFVDYVRHMREQFLHFWDNEHCPPRRGWTPEEIETEFSQLASVPTHEFWTVDELSGSRVIYNTRSSLGNATNAWFADQMYRVRINYSEDASKGRSIYDFFAKPEFFERYLPYARRHFLRDSFYLFAESVLRGASLPGHPEIRPIGGPAYVTAFAALTRAYRTHELLIEPIAIARGGTYSGYGGKLTTNPPLALSLDDLTILEASGDLPAITLRNVYPKHRTGVHQFHIRQYETGQKLFPALFRSFRISVAQYAVQYPPLTAKALYQEFLKDAEGPQVTVWDPSMGWGGRLIGAMSSALPDASGGEKQLHYVGTDPNPVFYKDGTSVYATLADTYNTVRHEASLFGMSHTYRAWQSGSETIRDNPEFQHYRGKLDLVFTSPPYFSKEAYADDPNQSYQKFPQYDQWRDGFLYQTLKTAYEWLKPNRYLLLNIADVSYGKVVRPLQQDTKDICEKLGFTYIETIYMTLAGMPGANRVKDDGSLTTRNVVKVRGRLMKCEPIFVFKKP